MNVETPPSTGTAPSTAAPQLGNIVVHEPKWHQRLAAFLIYLLVRAVAMTLRYRWERDPVEIPEGGRPYVFCTWHNRLPLSVILYEQYMKRIRQPFRLAAIVSASRDGAMMTAVLKRFKVLPARGSSSRRGAQVLMELAGALAQGYDAALASDGPRGPVYGVKMGVVVLAQITGRALVPASYHLSSKITVKSWDRFQIPLPFSKCTINFADPVPVPRTGGDEGREKIRAQVEAKLRELTKD